MKRIGTQGELTDEERAKLLDDLSYWHRQVSEESIYERREAFEKAFLCVWPGQDPSGMRKNGETEAWPFDGASDQRLRWGERIYRDKLALLTTAMMAAEVEFTCGGDAAGQEKARALKKLLAALTDSLGAKGFAETLAMMHYLLVDSPAVAALDVGWRKRLTMGVGEFYAEELKDEYSAWRQAQGIAQFDAAQEWSLAMAGEAQDEAAEFLVTAKKCRQKDVARILKALGEDGECEALVAVDANEGPEIKALRYGDDFCLPKATDDFDYASPMFRGQWCTESQLREKIADDDWDPEWVEETLGYKGYEMFNEAGSAVREDVRDLVNIVWCYTAQTNARGETTRYVSVLSLAEGSAFGKRVLKTRRGKWNIAFFRGEVNSSNILDARGLAEIAAPSQGVAKSLRDMSANNAIVGSLPPVKAKGTRTRSVLIEPFAFLPMGQNDDVTFMQPPAYPAAADKAEEKIFKELCAFAGISDGESDVTDRQRAETAWFLKQWRDFLVLLVETAQDNASDEYVMRATETPDAKGVKAQDIAGAFGISLKLDPTNLDNKKLIEKVQAAAQILQSMDRKGTVDTDPFVRHFFTMLFPEMANAALKSPADLAGEDVEEEKRNFALLKAGVIPRMDTEGKWNYRARLEWHRQLAQENPEALSEMGAAGAEAYRRWLAALEQMDTQFGENAEIGKTGVKGVEAAS